MLAWWCGEEKSEITSVEKVERITLCAITNRDLDYNRTYVFMVEEDVNLDARQSRQSLDFRHPERLVVLREAHHVLHPVGKLSIGFV